MVVTNLHGPKEPFKPIKIVSTGAESHDEINHQLDDAIGKVDKLRNKGVIGGQVDEPQSRSAEVILSGRFENFDFSGYDLTGFTLKGKFSGAIFNGAILCGAEIGGADFTGADLSRSVGLNEAKHAGHALFSNTLVTQEDKTFIDDQRLRAERDMNIMRDYVPHAVIAVDPNIPRLRD